MQKLRSYGATAGYVSCVCAQFPRYLRFGETCLCAQGKGLGYAETSLISYHTTWRHIPGGNDEMGECLPATRACETKKYSTVFM